MSSRVNKREQRRAERQRSSMFWNVVVLGTLGVALLLVGLYVFVIQRPGPLPSATPSPTHSPQLM